MSDGDLYCTIYVDTDMGHPGFVIMISDFLDGEIFLRNIDSEYLSISVMKNEDYDSEKKEAAESGAFVFYRYYLEVDPSEGVDYQTFVKQVKLLVNFLRSKGFRTVPSCDFEDELNDGRPYTEFMK